MTVREYRLADGRILAPKKVELLDEILLKLLRVSVLCNDAAFHTGGTVSHTVGDPTEIALLVAADSLEMDAAAERRKYDKLREYPFDSVSKRMIAVLRNQETGNFLAVLKGAPAVVLHMCTDFLSCGNALQPLDEKLRESILNTNNEMAGRGLRVLAFAEKRLDREADQLETGYIFLGFAGMTDPPRRGVKNAIRSAHDAGIRVVMLTGDQVMTARSIAQELNLSDFGDIYAMDASEIAGIDDASLASAASQAHVFARVSPEDKLRIVEAFQKAGEIVAVTGDGINDAPALKRSDIGIAMGMRGTEVAKEAADIILTDDNFSTIVKAIESGRTIYANIIKFVHLMFSHNLGEVLVIFASIAIGLPLPLLPLQILWMNLVTDIFPALALAVEPASGNTMKHGPRAADETMLSARFLLLIGWQGSMLAIIAFSSYFWSLSVYGEGPHARTVALMALIGVQFGHTFNCRSRSRSAFDAFFSNPYIFAAAAIVILLQVAAFAIAPLSRILELTPPNWPDILVTLICILSPILIVEFTKLIERRRRKV